MKSAVVGARVVAPEQERRQRERHVRVPESRQTRPRHAREATTSRDEADARAVRGARLGRGGGVARRRGPSSSTASCPVRSGPVHLRLAPAMSSRDGGRPSSTGVPTTSSTSRCGEDDGFYGDCARRCARCRAARSSPTASSPRLPGGPAPRAPRGRSAPAATSRRSSPCTASSRRAGSAAGAASGSTTSDGCWSSRVSPSDDLLSDDLRDELAQIAPARRCCRHAELSALFHASGAWHLRGGHVAVHLDLASSAAARRAFALLRDLGVQSEIRTYSAAGVRPGDALPAARRGRRARARGAARGGRPLAVRRAARASAEARRRPLLLPRGLPPRRAARRRLAVRPARPASRAPRERPRGRALHRRGRRAGRTCELAVAERRGARRRLREGARADRGRARDRRGGGHRAAPRGARGRRRDRAPTRTASRTPTRRTSCARRARRTPSSRRSAHSASTRCRLTSPRSPSCDCAIRRRRCASSRRRHARRSPRLPHTGVCRPS